jgi:hypothetical protein
MSVRGAHGAGVTVLRPHPTRAHLLASGSYDEQVKQRRPRLNGHRWVKRRWVKRRWVKRRWVKRRWGGAAGSQAGRGSLTRVLGLGRC